MQQQQLEKLQCVCTGQDWAKKLKEGIFGKRINKVYGEKSRLQDEHKTHLAEFFNEHPRARVEKLAKKFEGFTLENSFRLNVTSVLKNYSLLRCKKSKRQDQRET